MPQTLRQRAVQRLIRNELVTVSSAIHGAWDDYMSYSIEHRLKHTARSRASLVHDHMVYRAREAFEPVPHIANCQVRGGLFLLLLRGRVVIRFKKLDEDLQTCNIPTQQSLGFLNQDLELPGMKSVTFLQAGYRLNREETAIQGVFITCPAGNSNDWAMELPKPDVGGNVLPLVAPPNTGPRITPKIIIPKQTPGEGSGI